ncbi:MAG: hypothetical protein GF320_20825 [Armatimonadia bacterium]|nr:hypothetical protein [Armatimonadia bacterium]
MAIEKQCCVCGRVPREADDQSPAAWIKPTSEPRKVSHTYCPECYAALRAQLRRFAAQRAS